MQLLQLGGLANAFGNGVVLPFMLIYLHNVQGISLGTAGLILATNGVRQHRGGADVAAPSSIGSAGKGVPRRRPGCFLTIGFAGYILVDSAWKGFIVAAVS